MSRYLVDRIAALPNVEVVTQARGHRARGPRRHARGDPLAQQVRCEETQRPIRHLFLFIGAEPNTDWLADSACAARRQGLRADRRGAGNGRAAAGDEPPRRLRDRRRALGLGQARRRRGRRGRAGRRRAARLSRGALILLPHGPARGDWVSSPQRRHKISRRTPWTGASWWRSARLVRSLSALHPRCAQTPTWPQRSVRFLVPLGPGSGVDITARLIADKLSAKWGKPVVVENKPGGDAIVAITAFTGANDDHTLLMAPTSTFTAHPFLHEKLPYDVKELVPIVRVSNTVIAIGVPASLGINSMDELLKRAKAEPGKLNMASATGANDFVTVGFLKQANVDIARVPYRDTVQAINDLAEGRIQLYVAAYAIMRPQVQAGKVKVLALMNNERAPMLPDVPTAREAGTPGLSMDGLVGLFGAKEMPKEVRDQIAADVIAAARDPELSTRIGATGQIVRPGGADEFAKEIELQAKIVSNSAAAAGIKRMLQN